MSAGGGLERRQSGGALLDVLVAMGVLSGAVAGVAQLQAVAFRQGADARLRSVATMLARAKLDDLRGHSQLESGAAGSFGYDEIADDAGGSEDARGGLRLPPGTVFVDGLRFERHWTSTPLYFCGPDATPTALPCPGDPPSARPALRVVTVVITWTDRDGSAQRLALEGSAAAIDALSGAAPFAVPG